jgi:hypothetical protein
MLLWGPDNLTPLLRGLLRTFRSSILHQMIPLWRSTRGSSRCLPLLLSNSQVDHLIISVYLDGVQMIFELSTQASAKAIPLFSISVSMIARVLIEVVKSQSILDYSAITLGKS